jgi:hypothetical protein
VARAVLRRRGHRPAAWRGALRLASSATGSRLQVRFRPSRAGKPYALSPTCTKDPPWAETTFDERRPSSLAALRRGVRQSLELGLGSRASRCARFSLAPTLPFQAAAAFQTAARFPCRRASALVHHFEPEPLRSVRSVTAPSNVRAEATREAWRPVAAQDNGACDCPARPQGAMPRGVASRARG